MLTTEEILCSKTHEYILKRDDFYYIGLTEYFLKKMGETLFIELAEPNTTLNKGEIFGTIQASNSSVSLYMPISGTIVEINEAIVLNYDILKEENNWIIKIKSDSADMESFDLYDYQDYLEEFSFA